MVLGWTVPLALLSWPGAMDNDSSLSTLFLALLLFVGGSLLILASLLYLKVHWLLVIGVILLALLTPYIQGRLFPTDASSWASNWFLTYGGVIVVLSLVLLGRAKEIRPDLWRTLLVTGASAVVVFAVAYGCAQIAASGPIPGNGTPPAVSLVYSLVSLLVGSIDIRIIVHVLTRKGREHSLSN